MLNFLNFIEEDIENKKTLLSTMPTKTKINIRKYNDKIDSIIESYTSYRGSVKKYLDVKSKNLSVKSIDSNIDELNHKVTSLEHVRFILNPMNTYLEKMGFDNLLYRITNYHDFDFNFLNDLINEFIDKFEIVGIKLTEEDFNYTCYVKEYMKSFLEVRNSKEKKYGKVSEVFERIYWLNPDLIEHIELNFRLLIKKNEKKFNNYISKIKKEVLEENKIKNYEDCLAKLTVSYNELNYADREDICDIIEKSKNSEIDINNYLEDSKVRSSTYTELMLDSINLDDKKLMSNFYENLEKLRINLEEYKNYIDFLPLFEDFKETYQKQISTKLKDNKALKDILSKISSNESKLFKLNKKIFKNKGNVKSLKIDSVKIAKDLYGLYMSYDEEYFKSKIMSILNETLTVSELLNLYYSYDFFKKSAIKKVFKITKYDDLLDYSDRFDLFAMNPTNKIIEGEHIFEDNDVAEVIMNKYRLCNINIAKENLNGDDIVILLDKIALLLRIEKIEQSSTTIEKIWFITNVNRINKSMKKEG